MAKIWKYTRVIPRVVILLPLFFVIKLGEGAGYLYDVLSPHLPGLDR